MKRKNKITIKNLEKLLSKKEQDVKNLLKDHDKIEKFLENVREYVKQIPEKGNSLSDVAEMLEILNDFVNGQYNRAPIKIVIVIIMMFVYLLAQNDLIPDSIPLIGYLDDGIVAAIFSGIIKNELKEYREWKMKQNVNYSYC